MPTLPETTFDYNLILDAYTAINPSTGNPYYLPYTDEQAEALIESEVDKINEDHPRFKKIAHFIIRKREFDKTTGLKIRRFVEDNKHA